MNGGFNKEIIYKRRIVHCQVLLPDGTRFDYPTGTGFIGGVLDQVPTTQP